MEGAKLARELGPAMTPSKIKVDTETDTEVIGDDIIMSAGHHQLLQSK